jgi:hypothetical protein
MTPIPIAGRDLPANHLIRQRDLDLKDVTGDLAPDTVRSVEALVGRYLREKKSKGASFLSMELADEPSVPALDEPQISLGLLPHRALAGLLEPGETVDVYGTPKPDSDGSQTRCLAEGLRVVAVLKPAPTGEIGLVLALPGDDGVGATCARLTGATDLFVVLRRK